jgi:hypothetical protein
MKYSLLAPNVKPRLWKPAYATRCRRRLHQETPLKRLRDKGIAVDLGGKFRQGTLRRDFAARAADFIRNERGNVARESSSQLSGQGGEYTIYCTGSNILHARVGYRSAQYSDAIPVCGT